MPDAVITAALQAGPLVGAVLAVLGLLIRREITSNTAHRADRAEWRLESQEDKAEIKRLEKELDQANAKRRAIEDAFSEYRRANR